MTLDEMKVEAEKLGYNLIKKPEIIKMLPCTCGCKRRTEWFCEGQFFYSCNRCGKKSPLSKTTRGARRAWNVMIEGEEKKDDGEGNG